MAGVTSAGFTIKSLAEIVEDLEAEVRAALGDAVRLDGRSVLGQILGAQAIELAATWEALGEIAASLDPDTAVGAQLDAIVALSGVSARLPARASTGTLTLTGTPAAVVPAGARVSTAAGDVVVETLAAATIGGGGTVDVSVQATVTGALAAPAGTLTSIVTPYPGWASATNAAALTPGRAVETDLELRARREASLQSAGDTTDGGIRAALLAINEVEQAIVRSNRSGATDADGTPAAAFRCILYPDPASAAVEEAIAAAIAEHLPAGIRAWGADVTATVTDSQGVDTTIQWDYADEVTIYVTVTCSLAAGSVVSATEIRDAIVAEINSLTVGEDVRVLAIYQAIGAVSDVLTATTLKVDTVDPPVLTGDVTIALDEIARATSASVVVTIA